MQLLDPQKGNAISNEHHWVYLMLALLLLYIIFGQNNDPIVLTYVNPIPDIQSREFLGQISWELNLRLLG